jgi:uncharacterized phage protein gp47/JayE
VDVNASIVALTSYQDKTSTVQQDVADNISTTLSSNELGTIIDASDVIDGIYNVEGVDRVRITKLNKTGETGTKESITAGNNEYIAPGTINVTIEER